MAGAVIAPTTLVTSLLFYFGFNHAFWFFNYFGVNSTVLGLTNSDFVMRSADALFVPVLALGSAALSLVWAHSLVRARLAAESRPMVLRRAVPVLAGLGLPLVFSGIWSVFNLTVLRQTVALAPLCLGTGVLLTLYAVRLRRALRGDVPRGGTLSWPAMAEWAGAFALVALSLFWAATDYSAAVGRAKAFEYAARLPDKPGVVVFSERSLSLTAPGVREVRCQDPQAAYRFRYDGLKLLVQSGDQYVFLPEQWSRSSGNAIVIPRSDHLRLEFTRPDAAPPAAGC